MSAEDEGRERVDTIVTVPERGREREREEETIANIHSLRYLNS
jgi:hypothetical protein